MQRLVQRARLVGNDQLIKYERTTYRKNSNAL